MRVVAKQYGVSIDAVTYVLRKTGVPRRSFTEANKIKFEAAPPSFTLRPKPDKELGIIGAMLYWAEGYKTDKASGIDFANSDPDMVLLFVTFLRNRYDLDQRKLHFSLFYYSDQALSKLVGFWSKKLDAPGSQFKTHYEHPDPKTGRRKMLYGVLHVRYFDKKLLRDVLNLIESYRSA